MQAQVWLFNIHKIGDGPDTDELEARIHRPVNQARPQF
jgi:hypothetical protein